MSLIAFLLRSSWQIMAIAIVTGFISGGATASLIALISQGVAAGVSHSLDRLAWGFVGLAIVALISSIISQVTLIHLAQRAIFQLRLTLSRQVLASELAHLEKLGAPQVLATLTDDVQSVADAVRFVPFLCIDGAIVAGCLVYIVWLSWQVFLLVCLLLVVAMGSCQWLLGQGHMMLMRARIEQDRLFKHFRSITDGIKELKLSFPRRQAFLHEELQASAAAYRRHNTRGLTLYTATSSLGNLIFFFAVGFVLFALPKLMTLDLRTLSGYVLTFTYLMLPMDNIFRSLPVFGRAKVALQKIESLNLSLAGRTEATVVPAAVHPDWREWTLKQVSYTYQSDPEEEPFVLGPINLTLQPGELVFIVGGNGSGKSTLAKLLTGLYEPHQGEILLDRQVIDTQNREWYRQHFSAVFADFYLFDRLLGFDSDHLDRQAATYLKQLKLEGKVTVSNGMLSTTALSQGQRKRLALLTTYLEDRPIYLFDEWAADQDPAFKDLFYTKFLPQLKEQGKTVVVISHDDHYFHVCDRLLKLDYGQIEYDKRSNP